MRVVVTGASGYLGRHLTPLLEQTGHDVVPLGRADAPGMFRDATTQAVGPLADMVAGAQHVIHLAGQLVHDPTANIDAYYTANVRFTEQVMEAASAHNVMSVVHASSRLVYPATLTEAAQEDRDPAPDSAYGLSKLWAENTVRHYSRRHDLPAVSLRIGQVTGGDHPGLGAINSFVRQALAGKRPTVHGTGRAIRDIVHVMDVASACVSALDHRGTWLPVNIGGTRPVTILELARSVAAACFGDDTVDFLPADTEDTSCYALAQNRAHTLLGWHAEIDPDSIVREALKRMSESR